MIARMTLQVVGVWASLHPIAVWAQATGSIEIDFRDQKSNAPLVCRLQVLGANGNAMRGRGVLYQQGWNLVEETFLFRSRAGDYTYTATHGPEFAAASGGFTLDRKSNGVDVVHLPRHADLPQEGWYAGDLLCYVDAAEAVRWLPAEQLVMTAVVTESTGEPRPEGTQAASEPTAGAQAEDGTGWAESGSCHDQRSGSGLVLHHWQPPAAVPQDLPSSRLLVMAKQSPAAEGSLPVHAEIQKLWARDVPLWLASGHIDSIQLLSDHLTIDGQRAAEFTPLVDPQPGRFRGPRRFGRWVEAFYWKVLECGLRIPPSAGSGFGRTPSPLGYNRVYAHLPTLASSSAFAQPDSRPKIPPAAWWSAVRAGTTFVTNGPLLRATVNERYPGSVFSVPAGQSLAIDFAVTLTVADPVEYLDVIFNGQSIYQARLDEFAMAGGKIPTQSISESGWLIVRVVTERDHTYRFACTAPFYFEVGGTRRISRSAVAFFQAWLDQTQQQIAGLDSPARTAAAPYLQAAQEYWNRLSSAATVD